jgi:hypothetical protein
MPQAWQVRPAHGLITRWTQVRLSEQSLLVVHPTAVWS